MLGDPHVQCGEGTGEKQEESRDQRRDKCASEDLTSVPASKELGTICQVKCEGRHDCLDLRVAGKGRLKTGRCLAQETEFMVLLPTVCGHCRWAVDGGQRHMMSKVTETSHLTEY